MYIEKMNNDNERTKLLKKNIAGSLIIKGWSCFVQLLLVPLTLNCLNQYEYGIWLTINSILIWIDQFDIGLGNGLRNKLAESIAQNDKKKGRILVSTTFIMLFLIVIPILLLITTLILNLDCYKLLNIEKNIIPNLNGILLISFAFVGSTFIFKFIGNLYLGLQLPAINNLLVVAGQTVSLIIIALLSLCDDHSLMHVAIAYTSSPLIIYLISYPITFTKYSYYRPSLKLFEAKELKGLLGLGLGFFLVQIAGLIIFASSNLLISNLFSPEQVTPYQISYRYFSITIMIFSLIAAPLWSASTDAYTKSDWTWIKGIMRKMQLVMGIFFIILIIMTIFSIPIYHIWVGNQIKIPLMFSGTIALYMFILIYSTCYSNILFGIGKIKLITIITIIEAIIYIPLAIILGRKFGTIGIIYALITVNLLCAVTNKIQFHKQSTGRAKGIWNR
jgi:O-antigen/teichoic acid export membrane protein